MYKIGDKLCITEQFVDFNKSDWARELRTFPFLTVSDVIKEEEFSAIYFKEYKFNSGGVGIKEDLSFWKNQTTIPVFEHYKESKMSFDSVKKKTVDSLQEGMKIGGSRKAVETVVSILKRACGSNYPSLLTTPLGSKLEPYVASVAILSIVALFENRFPTLKNLETVANKALTGFAANDCADLLTMLEPLAVQLVAVAPTLKIDEE
jgi:hypothetical protein